MYLRSIIISIVLIISLSSCNLNSKKNDDQIQVEIVIPEDSQVKADQLRILAGVNNIYSITDTNFQVRLSDQNPVISFAQNTDESPVFIGLLDKNLSTSEISAKSTAVILTFIGLSLYTENPDDFSKYLTSIASVPAVINLSNIISVGITKDPKYMEKIQSNLEFKVSLKLALEESSIILNKNIIKNGKPTNYINPLAKNGIEVRIEESQLIAKNKILRYANALIDGPEANKMTTLISPCAPPIFLFSPSETVISPSPFPIPTPGNSYSYSIRVTGGLDNTNNLFNPSIDETNLLQALELTGIYDIVFPLLDIMFGICIKGESVPNMVFAFQRQYSSAINSFINNIINAKNNNEMNIAYYIMKFAGDLFDTFISDPQALFTILGKYFLPSFTISDLMSILKNANIFLKGATIVLNISTMTAAVCSIWETPMVDIFKIDVSESNKFIDIPESIYLMGSSLNSEEQPLHSVKISKYRIYSEEISQNLYSAVMGYNPSGFFSGANAKQRPVEGVTWYDAVEFCNKLSTKEGIQKVYTITNRIPLTGYPITSATVKTDFNKNGYRLPTEAEWEFAARGGPLSLGFLYSGSNNINEVAWWAGSEKPTHPVGEKSPNEIGLYDMSGNVMEWCQDWYGSYSSESQTDPLGPGYGIKKVLRGGSIMHLEDGCRVTFRSNPEYPGSRGPAIGFRIVCRQ